MRTLVKTLRVTPGHHSVMSGCTHIALRGLGLAGWPFVYVTAVFLLLSLAALAFPARAQGAPSSPTAELPLLEPSPTATPPPPPEASPATVRATSALRLDLQLAPAPRSRMVLAHTTAVLTTLATGVVSGLAGWFIPGVCFEATGRPDPVCSASGLVLGSALQVGLAMLLVPETYRLADDASGTGNIAVARATGWRWGRWAAMAGLICVSTYLVGALLEKASYGTGQAAMVAGGLGTLASWMAFDVTQLLGASAGYQESRRVNP